MTVYCSGRSAGGMRVRSALVGLAMLVAAPAAHAEDAVAWLTRAAASARQTNYVGTILYTHGNYVETSRLVHLYDLGEEFDKLVNLEGPAREVIRNNGEVRCYYPDFKLVRVEPRTFRNAFPSLSPQQQKALAEFYEFRKAETGRVAGLETQAWVFEPKDGLRYGHKFWADAETGLIVKARVFDEGNVPIEQFTFTDLTIGAKIDRDMVKPTWLPAPPGWKIRQSGQVESDARETGWTVTRAPPGFMKIVDGYRRLQEKRQVAHLVYSDGLASVSVFVEQLGSGTPHARGSSVQGGLNVYSRQVDGNQVTVLGQVPGLTLRQIANSVVRRPQ